MALKITNKQARWLWLDKQGLSRPPTGPATSEALAKIIRRLGFVQLDTIRVIARAHDHILWSRNQNYREEMMHRLLSEERQVFEHFTHDASVLPMAFYPFWQRQCRRMADKLSRGQWANVMPSKKETASIRNRIEREGALCTKDFTGKADKSRHAWARPPHKYALDYMWYAGDLATCHRHNFIKYYDLSERVIPVKWREAAITDTEQLDWLCREALARLGFGTPGDIQRFWDAADLSEVRSWSDANSQTLVEVEIEHADKTSHTALAPVNIEEQLSSLSPPTARLRIINPFDPVARDRDRLLRLFGFDYRIEIFVPAAKRQYGYYVYPILEGDRFVGRIEAKADRKKGTLTVEKLWWEIGVRPTSNRLDKLSSELTRIARFVGTTDIIRED
ncbi:MAG: winged helix DNA-binding domain-containing protein, partial [Aquisalinus sp.]|nr:winged helix DNA-binding domain-containing protein [Aquisalinus sp.]